MLAKSLRSLTAVIVATATVLTPAIAVSATAAGPSDSAVVTRWNAIADRTIFTENLTPVPVSGLYFGFVSIAMYDAAVAIKGGYEPYALRLRGVRHASADVAVATAAYKVLSHYFPASKAQLDADYAAELSGANRKVGTALGKVVGWAAARAIIRLREDDGRGAAITLDATPAPGVWRPTPDLFAPMLAPWLGFVKPLALASPTQIPLPGPDPLESASYAADFAEVAAFGEKEGSSRTVAQTETALFYNDNAMRQYQAGLRDLVTRHGYGVTESARAFALLSTATADSLVSCWRAKYDYAYWRPITAIQLADTDGNDATVADPTWVPLAATPPYPEYTSGHACLTGAASNTFAYLFGKNSIDLNLTSAVTGTSRHYDSAAALDAETMNARIWLGIHFRTAMTDGNKLGHAASTYTIRHEFTRR